MYDEKYFEREERYAPYFDAVARVLVSVCHPRRVLDIGCSFGTLVRSFRMNGVEAFGCDISSYALHKGQSDAVVKGFLVRCNIDYGLPFKDGYFDLLTLLEVLEHVENERLLIQEMARVLRDGGYVFMTAPTPRNELLAILSGRKDSTHINIRGVGDWIKTFEQFGFEYVNYSRNLRRVLVRFTPPHHPIGKLLSSLGAVGEKIREHLSYLLLSPTYLFKKSKSS